MSTRGLPAWPWAGLPVECLPGTEGLLLDSARAWAAAAAQQGRSGLPAARHLLVTEDLGHLAPALDAMLRALAPAGGVGCPLCPRVSRAEARLLTALALAQRGTRREALALFLGLAPGCAAYAAMGPALGLVASLRRAGRLLAPPLRAAP